MNWAMLDRAARMAEGLGDAPAAAEYRALADKTREAVFRELWNPTAGRLGSIGADGLWRGHGQHWEQYLAANAGLLAPEQARSAMRWVESHYGFEPNPGIRLLSISALWPIVWSSQWVPVGDTLLAALAGLRAGDEDLWWPYIRTVVGSAFRSDRPGIGFGISNHGASGSPGDLEDIDAVDPHTHLVVRGLFGIEPALHEGRLTICPAFPSGWREASIRTPDVSYQWRREGDRATFRIRTPQPRVKVVRANLTGEAVTTPAETESVVAVTYGPALPPPAPPKEKTILAEQQPPAPPRVVTEDERRRLVRFDLAEACNLTCEELLATAFQYDVYPEGKQNKPAPLNQRSHKPVLVMPASPRELRTSNGWEFLVSGRQAGAGEAPAKNLLAVSSWPPYPLPGGAVIPVGMRCESLCLLLQNYVHPLKNYIPNGEVVLRYADGEPAIESLIPPYNLDTYYQPFARSGVAVPFGHIARIGFAWAFPQGMVKANANALEIRCDPKRVLAAVELRATCSEGIIGLAGMTALEAVTGSP
jgi:hypothetical protein